jgi:hypothetical protein
VLVAFALQGQIPQPAVGADDAARFYRILHKGHQACARGVYLFGYANLTNTRSLALLGDPDSGAYELLFSLSSPEEKNEFLNLVSSNEDMGKDYIIEFAPPTSEENRGI